MDDLDLIYRWTPGGHLVGEDIEGNVWAVLEDGSLMDPETGDVIPSAEAEAAEAEERTMEAMAQVEEAADEKQLIRERAVRVLDRESQLAKLEERLGRPLTFREGFEITRDSASDLNPDLGADYAELFPERVNGHATDPNVRRELIQEVAEEAHAQGQAEDEEEAEEAEPDPIDSEHDLSDSQGRKDAIEQVAREASDLNDLEAALNEEGE